MSITGTVTSWISTFVTEHKLLILSAIGLIIVIKYAWENMDEIQEFIDKHKVK